MDNLLLRDKINFSKELINIAINSTDKFVYKKQYKKSGVILKPDDKGKVFIILHGRATEYVLDKNTKYILSILSKGEIFGDFGIDVLPKMYVEALDNATVRVLETKQFTDIVEKDPKLLLKIFAYFYMKLQQTQEKLISSSHHTVATRLINLLMQLSNPVNISSKEYMTEKFTHNEISQMLGVSRQTVTVTINKLVKSGLLKKRKRAYILNKEELLKSTDIFDNKLGKIRLKLKQLNKT